MPIFLNGIFSAMFDVRTIVGAFFINTLIITIVIVTRLTAACLFALKLAGT